MNTRVLEEEEANGGEPSEEEVGQYAEFLGIDLSMEPHLKWIAHEGLMRPAPIPWKACTENGVDVFYFNFETGESIWDHPCDQEFRNMVEECRAAHTATSRSDGLPLLAAATTGATEESKTNIKVAIAAPGTLGAPRFLPSRTMKAILDDMWICPITDDKQLVAEIQSKVETKCDVRSQLCGFPSLFPGFVDKVLENATAAQEEIDDAWLDAALDLLGRPTMKHGSTIEFHMQDVEREDPLEMTQIGGQRMSSFGSDDRETMDFSRYDPHDLRHDVLHPSQVHDQLFMRTWSDGRASITQSPSIDFSSNESDGVSARALWRSREFQALA